VGVDLAPRERLNHFPATPACTVTWFLQGDCESMAGGESLQRIVFAGPQTRPTCTYNPGPVRAFMLVALPDALRALTGIEPGAHVDRLGDARGVFGGEWQPLLQAVLDADDDARRVDLIENFVAPRWHAARGDHGPMERYRDWTRALASRVALSGIGRSVRQAERRIHRWAGLPLRELHALSRAEASFIGALDAKANGRLNWADIAAEAGYSDQSHLCRGARRVSGCSPRELLRRVEHDEAFWIYRVWR
jgi:AraC-like DNA-binding protein